MSEKPCVIIVEDKEEDRREVLNYLADQDFCDPKDVLGTPSNYDEALAILNEKSSVADVVFLDLNVPRNDLDARPEKGHGKRLLDHIHGLNQRAGVDIKVIVVSAEELADDWEADMLRQLYRETLVGVVQKAALAPMLKANLRRFRRDPIRSRSSRLGIDVLEEYDIVMDPARATSTRLEKARTLAIRLTRNEMDYFERRLGASELFADNLDGLIKELRKRFEVDARTQRPEIKASAIRVRDGWGGFLWRGWHIQHLYTLNSYRNGYVHEDEQPYQGVLGSPNKWAIPQEVSDSISSGKVLGQIAELIVRDLLEWYIPWHEQVYLPWLGGLGGGTAGRP
jgi:CheY-like chemotaxis protein